MDKIEKAPQVIAEKITHRLIDGEKEESFAVRLSRAGDEENHGGKNIAKGDDRLSDGTMDEKKSPYSARVEGILVVQIVFGRNGR